MGSLSRFDKDPRFLFLGFDCSFPVLSVAFEVEVR